MKNMKKTIFILTAFTLFGIAACRSTSGGNAVDAAHRSSNSVDWVGVYTGTIPAASAPGIEVVIELRADETYDLSYTYIDKDGEPLTAKGSFSWDDAGNTITLNDSQGLPPYYAVGENTLTQMDMAGKPITGEFADMYILRKTE